MKNRIAFAAAVAAAITGFASAEFANGNLVSITGTAGPELGGTGWGTGFDQGQHALGGQSQFHDAVFGRNYPVFVTSTVVNPYSVIFHIDFSLFFPGDFSVHTIDIVGLKSDGSILGVQGNSTGFSTDGNTVTWQGSGAELASLGSLDFKVFQSPAPGALALLGMAGLAGTRRRRA